MRLSDINTQELESRYFEGGLFNDYWNNLDINRFKVSTEERRRNWNRTDYLDAKTLKYLQNQHKKMDSIFIMDVDKGISFNYIDEVKFEPYDNCVRLTLSQWFENQYKGKTNCVSMWKYTWFEVMRGTDLYVSVPNQNINHNIDIHINELGELIIDNNEK